MKSIEDKTKRITIKNDAEIILIEACRNLPLKKGVESKIPSLIRELIIISGLSSVNDKKQAIECGRDQAKKEVKAFENKAINLLSHIKDMHKTSRNLLEYKGTDRTTFSTHLLEHDLENLVRLCKLKENEIQNLPSFQKHRPVKNQAQNTVKCLGRIYKTLTGKSPSRAYNTSKNSAEGPFFDFVKNALITLGIPDSPENQIKKLMEKSDSKQQR